MSKRTYWYAHNFNIEDEPLIKSLLKYRLKRDRQRTKGQTVMPNLVSSITDDGKQMPILDLDFPFKIVESTTPGHAHLFFDVPISKWRWMILMWALYQAKIIELGFFVWSIRRGGNFVRIPGKHKNTQDPKEAQKSTYGWFFKLKEEPKHHHGSGVPCNIPRCAGDAVMFEEEEHD